MTARLRGFASILDSPARQNSTGSAVNQGSQRLSRLLPIIVAAFFLEPAPFAALAVALALADILRAALLALDVSAVRLLTSGTRPDEVLVTHLVAKIALGAVGQALVVVVAALAFGNDAAEIVAITGLGLIPAGMAGLLLVRRQVDLRLWSATPAIVTASAVSGGAAIIGVALTRDARLFALGLAVGDVLLLVQLGRDIPSRGWRLRPALELLRRTPSLIAMQVAYIGQFRVGTLVLGALGTAVAVGEYTVATRVAEGLVIVASAVSATSYPQMAAALGRGDRALAGRVFDRTYTIAVLAAVLLIGPLTVLTPVWLALLFPRYPGASLPFALVGASVIVFFASSQTTAFLNAAHRDRSAMLSSLSGLLVAVVSTVALAPMGAVGASGARLLGEGARQLLEMFAVARSRPSTIGPVALVWSMAIPIVALGIVVGLDGWHSAATLGAVAAGLIVAGGALAFARGRIGDAIRG